MSVSGATVLYFPLELFQVFFVVPMAEFLQVRRSSECGESQDLYTTFVLMARVCRNPGEALCLRQIHRKKFMR